MGSRSPDGLRLFHEDLRMELENSELKSKELCPTFDDHDETTNLPRAW